jgi:hypothetical protein
VVGAVGKAAEIWLFPQAMEGAGKFIGDFFSNNVSPILRQITGRGPPVDDIVALRLQRVQMELGDEYDDIVRALPDEAQALTNQPAFWRNMPTDVGANQTRYYVDARGRYLANGGGGVACTINLLSGH